MTALDAVCAAYWEAFRQGYFRVGGRPEDYPAWDKAPKAIREETMRCMRHAVEPLKEHFTPGLWDEVFPERLAKRGEPLTSADLAFTQQTKLAERFE